MLRTDFCELVGIEHPIVQASIGPWTSVELTAAVSNAGAIGSYGTALKPPEAIREELARLRDATDRPYVVNHTLRPLSEEAFQISLDARPRVISLAIGIQRSLVDRAKDAGCLFMQQVHTVEQAEQAAEAGADIVIAQGGEAGGFGGGLGTLGLVPQVVDAVAPIPVLAAGGIADGRGLAAALVLGAQGVNVGTRFVAAEEAQVPDAYKQAIVGATSQDAVKVEFADRVFPPTAEGGFNTLPRVIRTPYVERGNAAPDEVERDPEGWRAELMGAVESGRAHEVVPFAGETVGMIDSVMPARAIVESMVGEAGDALHRAAALASAA
jgi:enoyl-[acyl-carrier protein] reductase II